MKDYVQKPDAELKQLAQDIYDQKVFTSAHVSRGEQYNIAMIFMPIALGAFKGYTQEDLEDLGLMYEYYSEAMPRGINGMPIFPSVRLLNKLDLEKVNVYYIKYSELKKAFNDDEEKPHIDGQV